MPALVEMGWHDGLNVKSPASVCESGVFNNGVALGGDVRGDVLDI